ncbi:MAG TPA: [acyl-carrier-protein] S-malonyltransferase [Firmicutes bacterium]|nr:[acyl-carrier-protein] S-malonyltransferase [Bacillota bacterium]
MMKTAFLFSGQGSQYCGMGKELCSHYPAAAAVFKQASWTLGYDIEGICFADNDRLNLTEYTQPAIVTTSLAILAVLQEYGFDAAMAAGLSLGEYSALAFGGALSSVEAIKLVSMRGKYMQKAVPAGVGTMATILGLARTLVLEAVQEASSYGIVEAANFNCPGQIAISGEVVAVEQACRIAKEKGARRVVPLNVSAPFHCSMLKPAAIQLRAELETVKIKPLTKTVYSNVTAQPIDDSEAVRELLTQQVVSPVLWEDTIIAMAAQGVDTFIEIGPGKVLTGFAKKITPEAVALNVEDLGSLAQLLEFAGAGLPIPVSAV